MRTILIVSDNLPNQVNGVVTTFTNIEKQAVMNGYTVKHINPSFFWHFPAPGYPEVKISLAFGITQLITKINPSYIHICTEGPIGVAVRHWCCRRGYHYNTSYHTKYPEFLYKIYGIPQSLTYDYVRWFHARSHTVITTTKTMVCELQNHGFKNTLIPWTRGVNRALLKPTVQRTRSAKIRLLSVGRVSKEKGIENLCELSRDESYHITIVGDGPHRSELQNKYPLVEFVGYKHNGELANYYQNADVFCFTSCVDTFGVVIIEALALGCPVAAYPVPGPIDIIESGVDGYLDNDLPTAIHKCLTLNRLTIKANSAKWTWENCWAIFERNLVSIY
jgi:glycosyltransferase involved in cell wall biosynthesis